MPDAIIGSEKRMILKNSGPSVKFLLGFIRELIIKILCQSILPDNLKHTINKNPPLKENAYVQEKQIFFLKKKGHLLVATLGEFN